MGADPVGSGWIGACILLSRHAKPTARWRSNSIGTRGTLEQVSEHTLPMDGAGADQPALVIGGVVIEHRRGRTLVIGRGADADVRLEHPLVSRHHVAAEAIEGGWLLRDLQSRNGLFLGDQKVPLARLPANESVRLGSPDRGPSATLRSLPGDNQRSDPPETGQDLAEKTRSPGLHALARPPARPGVNDSAHGFGRLETVYEVLAERVRIGRAPSNDLVIAGDLRASRHHAELLRDEDGAWRVIDLASHNGTFLNGARVHRQARVLDGDLLSIGNHLFRFAHGVLEEYAETGGTSFEVMGLSAWSDDHFQLLDDVSFSLGHSSMLAVVGPSGVGKTSLLNALTGFRPADKGAVFFAGRDLYSNYDDLRRRMGYVPQEDIVHPQLSVRQALSYAAKLRFPVDIDAASRDARVDEVIAELSLSDQAGTSIHKLSGGQRKRVSVGIELLTKPSLLVLDEPTSGLDPGNEEHVMTLLRELADSGRVVIVVTHSLQSLDLADKVLFLAKGGTVAYYGPRSERGAYSARQGVMGGDASTFRAIEESPVPGWAERFRSDPLYETHVSRPLARADVQRAAATARNPLPPRPELPWRVQSSVLIRRQLALLRSDRRTLLLLLAQAPLFGVIDLLLFPPGSMSTSQGPFAALLVWLVMIGATWLGTSNAVREIVKEKAIYRRERSVGLSVGAYVFSKTVVLGGIVIVESVVLLFIAMARQHLPPSDPEHLVSSIHQAMPNALNGLSPFTTGALLQSPQIELAIGVALTGLAATAIGLLVSATVKRSDQALVVLPMILVVQIAVSMPLLLLKNHNPVLHVLGYLSSAQWGTAMGATTVSLNQLLTSYQLSLTAGGASLSYALGHPVPSSFVASQMLQAVNGYNQWDHAAGPWLLAAAVLVAFSVVGLLATWGVLRHQDVELLASPAAHPIVKRQRGPLRSRG